MVSVSSVRLAAPRAAEGEIVRKDLVSAILNSKKKITYIHAGAGYGKTTLLSQVAGSGDNIVWLTLDGESDVFTFIDILCEALRRTIPGYAFTASEFLPYERKDNFITILANALINSIEKFPNDYTIILDDLHTIEDTYARRLISCFMKYMPENIRLYLGSREAPWQELVPLHLRGSILELTQKELAFTRDETFQILGSDDGYIYNLTEGWPLAIGSFKMLLENGVSLVDIPVMGNKALYSYLFYECTNRLPSETVHFLKASAFFEELDIQMLSTLLKKEGVKHLLENLVSRNMFTVKTDNGQYRYHALFREYLQEGSEVSEKLSMQHKALLYYFDKKEYANAAEYAILSGNREMLQRIFTACYRDYIKNGNFSKLRVWFQSLGDAAPGLKYEIAVAKGAFLSSIGNFSEAKTCLDTVIPFLKEYNKELFIEAMVHKARVLRNFVSFEESTRLIDELLADVGSLAPDLTYSIVIEKVYNLVWNSQIKEAYTVLYDMIEACARAGEVRIKAWYERYLTAVHFFSGRMKDSVYYFEKSLELSKEDQQYLDMHSIGMFAAKCYQMLGYRDKAVDIITSELQKLRTSGRFEEMWSAYLLAAEIHYQNAFIDRMNGGSQTFETAVKYFILADEYAPLYRATVFQMQWAEMQRLVSNLIFSAQANESTINEILAGLDNAGSYLKTVVLGRLIGYYAALSDFRNAVKYAQLSIEIGERSNIMMIPTISYGIMTLAAISMNDHVQAAGLAERFLRLCSQNGIYEYFRVWKTYGPILEFAVRNGIEPDFAMRMMEFAGNRSKKAYVKTLGEFSVFPYNNRQNPLKMRTKKERELMAYILNAGLEGVTKEDIYNAIWSESESTDVKKLIGVNLAHIKKDLAGIGIENPLINNEKHYSIRRDEIVLDTDLLEEAAEELKLQGTKEIAQKILSLYKGEYLSDFEALWATGKRMKYHEIYKRALEIYNYGG